MNAASEVSLAAIACCLLAAVEVELLSCLCQNVTVDKSKRS